MKTFLQLASTGTATAAADVQAGDARVVVADLVVVVLPRVEVEVLILGLPGDGGADEHVVEGLAVHVEQVGVAVLGGHVGHIIEIEQTRGLLEGGDGGDLDELVEVTSSDDSGRGVLLEDLGNELASDGGLLNALLNAVVDGGAGVTVEGGGATLAGLVDVDGEEGLAVALDGLPGGSEGLAALGPGGAGGGNAAGVELELGALEDLVDIGGGTLVGVVQLNDVGAVDVGNADVTTGGTTILVVLGDNLGEVVHDAAELLNAGSQGGEGHVAGDGAVVGGTRVVLDLLEEDEIGGEHLLDDLGGNALHVGRLGVEVASVVVGDGDSTASTIGLERDGRVLGSGVADGRDTGQRQNAVEAEGLVDDTGDVAEEVTHAGVVGVLGTIGGGSNDDGLRVGIYS